ncbi:MAG: amidohydrolase [SAR202 cluster bacterium]|nr:amidohydrolase [SAR202 cluster bacterium]
MYHGFKVIDADAHFYEPPDIWNKYTEKAFYDRRPIIKESYMKSRLVYDGDGVLIPKSKGEVSPSTVRRYRDQEKKYGDAWRDWWSPKSRLNDMNKFGWDVQVALPTGGHLGAQISRKDIPLGAAIVRAYNNWAKDFCDQTDHRVKFAAVVPGGSSDEIVKEMHRAVGEMGAATIIISTPSQGHWWHQEEFDKVWDLAQDFDIPLSLHGNETITQDPATYARYNGMEGPFNAIHHAVNFPFEDMIGVAHFIMTGILDRFPKLKISILEANSSWLPFWLNRLEKCAEGRQSNTYHGEPLKATSWEYFQRQMFIACDADELGIDFLIKHVGDERIIFNTDYPHADAPDPWEPVPNMMAQPISNESKRKILWDNAVRLYGKRLLDGVKVPTN